MSTITRRVLLAAVVVLPLSLVAWNGSTAKIHFSEIGAAAGVVLT